MTPDKSEWAIPMGPQVGARPEDNPRWDGERILPYDEVVNRDRIREEAPGAAEASPGSSGCSCSCVPG